MSGNRGEILAPDQLLSICSSAYVRLNTSSLAVFGISQGKLEEAEPLYKLSLAIDEKVHGPDHPQVATDLNNWAASLIARVRVIRIFQETSCVIC